MNQFAGYTPFFGSAMANYQPNQQMPTNLGDPLIQKLLQQQVQQQIMSAFAPQNAGQDFFSMLTGGNGGNSPATPNAPNPTTGNSTALPSGTTLAKKLNGITYSANGTPNPHLAGMWQADRYI